MQRERERERELLENAERANELEIATTVRKQLEIDTVCTLNITSSRIGPATPVFTKPYPWPQPPPPQGQSPSPTATLLLLVHSLSALPSRMRPLRHLVPLNLSLD